MVGKILVKPNLPYTWKSIQLKSAHAKRAWAARIMMAEDARWAWDVIVSANAMPDTKWSIPFLFTHHWVRMAYEGLAKLNSPDPFMGERSLARQLGPEYRDLTARIRNQTKLADDTALGYPGMIHELEEQLQQSVANRAIPVVGTDSSLILADDEISACSTVVSFRLRLDLKLGRFDGLGITAVSRSWGKGLACLACATLNTEKVDPTLDLSGVSLTAKSVRIKSLLRRRYGREISGGERLLLLLIAGDLAANEKVLPLTAPGHEQAVFRISFLTTYRSLITAQQILNRNPEATNSTLCALREVQRLPEVDLFNSPELKSLRNTYVHYGVPLTCDPQIGVSGLALPQLIGGISQTELQEAMDRLAGSLIEAL